jgi:hypothetical protein
MQRDDSTERVDRPQAPSPRDRDALRQSIDAAWSRLIHADAPNAGIDTPPPATEPNRSEETPQPRPDSTASYYW